MFKWDIQPVTTAIKATDTAFWIVQCSVSMNGRRKQDGLGDETENAIASRMCLERTNNILKVHGFIVKGSGIKMN
jgi:hypothetical protein